MFTLLQHCLTGRDNKTWDIGRLLWGLCVLTFLGLAIIATWHTHAFDPQAFGLGAGGLLGGGGAGIGFKSKTEPSP